MYNPLANLQRALNNQAKHLGKSSIEVHGAVNIYEVLSFLLIFPSMFVSWYGFVLVAGNIFVAEEICKGQRILPGILIAFLNILYVPTSFCYWYPWCTDWGPFVAIAISFTLIISGYLALIMETIRVKNKSPKS